MDPLSLPSHGATTAPQASEPGDDEMGKGDKRTRKGKIYRGSYGKTRPGKLKKKATKSAAKRGA